jgi:hypothetical protein
VPTLALHDVEDAARFCSAIVTRSGVSLSWDDREDLEQFLLVEAWQLSLKFEPGESSFSSFAGARLRWKQTDWMRRRFGRTRWQFHDRTIERRRFQFTSLDTDDPERDRMVEAVGTGSGDPAAGGDPLCGGLLVAGDRQKSRDHRTLGLKPPGRAR